MDTYTLQKETMKSRPSWIPLYQYKYLCKYGLICIIIVQSFKLKYWQAPTLPGLFSCDLNTEFQNIPNSQCVCFNSSNSLMFFHLFTFLSLRRKECKDQFGVAKNKSGCLWGCSSLSCTNVALCIVYS